MKAQISIVESALILALFVTFAFTYGTLIHKHVDHPSNLALEDMGNLIYMRNDTRTLVLTENITDSNVNGNWSNITNLLSSKFSSYEIKISNLTMEKTIVSCTPTYEKRFTERVIAIRNNTLYDTRVIRVGVCS